ncbi:bromodomain containing protein [Stylonychia lemnae]|uniref:Bromodomain containing protein n=1 Tax=Stylonychia lemnae TaxID=5949 RepID=A0A077ZNW2_STYLE|nr:bromodomain containing protein [Stylonychia lemnae]|eukprot:CDW71159.1 bromodomain containing protein [Stylonychia lemnae]
MPHPTIDEIVVVAGSQGEICIIDIESGTLLRKKHESGLYCKEPQLKNKILSMNFSPDGSQFAIGTELGSISLFGIKSDRNMKICNVEQFIPQDNQERQQDPFIVFIKDTSLCNQNFLPYNYTSSINQNSETYEKFLELRQQEIMNEKQFYKDLKKMNGSFELSLSNITNSFDTDSSNDSDYTQQSTSLLQSSLQRASFNNAISTNEAAPRELARKLKKKSQQTPQKVLKFLSNSTTPSHYHSDVEKDFSVIEKYVILISTLLFRNRVIFMPEQDFNEVKDKECHFCQKSGINFIGPFLDMQTNQIYWFHQNCLEINDYIFQDKTQQSEVNKNNNKRNYNGLTSIIEAQSESPEKFRCGRCKKLGGTVSCLLCGIYFHGTDCAQLRLIEAKDYEHKYICYFCLNRERYNQNDLKQELTRISQFRTIKHTEINHQGSYFPQVGDIVYYLKDGHEEFIKQNDHLFFNGRKETAKNPFVWEQQADLLERDVLCEIVQVVIKEPSEFIRRQILEMDQDLDYLVKITLKILKSRSHFVIKWMRCADQHFLILRDIFNYQRQHFERQILNRALPLYVEYFANEKQLSSILEINESSTYWQSIDCKFKDDHEFYLINFWDINFQSFRLSYNINKKDQDFIIKQMEKVFKNFNKQGKYKATDCKQIDISLIRERLKQEYYRSKLSLISDLKVLYEFQNEPIATKLCEVISNINEYEFEIEVTFDIINFQK